MMKNKFSLSLYKEALRQLKLVGIMSFIVVLLGAVLQPISVIIRYNQYTTDNVITTETVSLLDMNTLLLLCMFVIAPVMVLYLFHFMNSRGASDFYHAVPQTRTSLFLSFFAAVLTWIAGIVLISSIVNLLILIAFPAYFNIDLGYSLAFLACVLAGSIFVAAAVAIGMCLSGTLLTNLVVSAIILFLPRILVSVSTSLITDMLPFVSKVSDLPLIDGRYNVVVGFVGSIFGGGYSYSLYLANWGAALYTLLMGVVFTAIALYLFNKRKSESAGLSAPSPKLQVAYRLITSAVFCLLPSVLMFQTIVSDSQGVDKFTLFVLYVIGVVIYYLYELVTTKSLKQTMNATRTLPLLAAFNILLIGIWVLMFNGCLNITPGTDDISYVRLISDGTNYYGEKDYYEVQTENIKYENESIREIVSRQLEKTVERCRKNGYGWIDLEEGEILRTVAIREGMTTHYREIILSKSDQKLLAGELAMKQEYVEIYMNLPPVEEVSLSLAYYYGDFTQENLKELYKSIKEEMPDISFEEWYNSLYTSVYYDRPALTMYTKLAGNTVSLTIPIDNSLPETNALFLNMLQKKQSGNKIVLIEVLKDLAEDMKKSDTARDFNITLTFYTKNGDTYSSTQSSYSFNKYEDTSILSVGTGGANRMLELAEALEANSGSSVAGSKNYVRVDLDYAIDTTGESGYNYSEYLLFNMDNVSLPEWLRTISY